MTIQQIPLSKLIPSPANVRRTGAGVGIEELAASIKALGLLQNLQVRAAEDGKFEVVAGRRRLAALKLLAKQQGHRQGRAEIPCHVLDEGEDAAEISLAENVMRLPMHPADQFEAFKALADAGKGPEDIAARFGCSPVDRAPAAEARQRQPRAARRLPRRGNDPRPVDGLHRQRRPRRAGKGLARARRMEPPPRHHPAVADRGACRGRRPRARCSSASRPMSRRAARSCATCSTKSTKAISPTPPCSTGSLAERLEREAEAVRAEGWKWVEIMPDLD